MHCLLINFFFGSEMHLKATLRITKQREINYRQCLYLKQAVLKSIYKKDDKETSGDRVGSILSQAVTHSHQCHWCKIGLCHTSKWDSATSSAIRPTSVIDDHRVEYERRQQRSALSENHFE